MEKLAFLFQGNLSCGHLLKTLKQIMYYIQFSLLSSYNVHGIFYLFIYFCQFTIYLTLMEVISKYDICLCLADGNCPAAALIHLIY
jgi:hypothetical protein